MGFGSALAVIAHPDDESFGLGAVLTNLVAQSVRARVLCFTRGEASTLGGGHDLGMVRAEELAAAGNVLGLSATTLTDYPDGELAAVPLSHLARRVEREATSGDTDILLVFDEGGITGHPDHCQATAAALIAAERLDLPVLAWAIPESVADQLNARYGTNFVGRGPDELDFVWEVDRQLQLKAIGCHASQSADNPVLWTRLRLLEGHEALRWLRLPAGLTSETVGLGPVSCDARS